MNEVKTKRKKKSRARSFAAWLSSFTFCCCCMPNFGPPVRMPGPIVINAPPPQPPRVQPLPKPVAKRVEARVSRANFNRLKDGMSLNEVEAILGPPNFNINPDFGTGLWDRFPDNQGHTRITVSFNQGRLSSKFFLAIDE